MNSIQENLRIMHVQDVFFEGISIYMGVLGFSFHAMHLYMQALYIYIYRCSDLMEISIVGPPINIMTA